MTIHPQRLQTQAIALLLLRGQPLGLGGAGGMALDQIAMQLAHEKGVGLARCEPGVQRRVHAPEGLIALDQAVVAVKQRDADFQAVGRGPGQPGWRRSVGSVGVLQPSVAVVDIHQKAQQRRPGAARSLLTACGAVPPAQIAFQPGSIFDAETFLELG